MKSALYWIKESENSVRCQLCPRNCIIEEGKTGFCKVRKNIKGELYSLIYSKAAAFNIDPIEKKPLFHFLPSYQVMSFGTLGCNLNCKHCQNWEISQEFEVDESSNDMTPEKIIELAKKNDVKIIAATYNEPAVFFEYTLDTFKLAKKAGIRTLIVSNGFINPEPLEELLPYLDAANIDIKCINNRFYKEITSAWINPVLDTCITLKKNDIWLEITNLIIPGLNDKENQIKQLATWIKENLGTQTPVHFTAFYPHYKLSDIESTKKEKLLEALETAKKAGLEYVYIGNVYDKNESTFCPKCNHILIKRQGYRITENNIEKGKCPECKTIIPGQWKS